MHSSTEPRAPNSHGFIDVGAAAVRERRYEIPEFFVLQTAP